MDKTSLIGIILAIIAVGVGMVFKGVSPAVLINPAAILIILVGTVAAVVIAFPTSEIKRVPKLFGILFKEQRIQDTKELIRLFSEWAQLARKEGLLALEAKTDEVEDPFLKNGLSLSVDGQSAEWWWYSCEQRTGIPALMVLTSVLCLGYFVWLFNFYGGKIYLTQCCC